MRQTRKWGGIALSLAAVLLLGSGAASGHHQGTTQVVTLQVGENISLPMNNWTGYTFTLAAGDSIQYGIQSPSENVDVFFFDATGLAAYQADPPQSSGAISSLTNRSQFAGVFSAATGTITLVVDNVDFSGAVPTGTVTVQVALNRLGGSLPPPDFLAGLLAIGLAVCVGLVLLVVVVIVVIIVLLTRRQTPAVPPVAPPYPPPQPPTWPPQQPPEGGFPPGP